MSYLRGGRVLLTEILLPRIARRGSVRLVSIRRWARKARIEKLELDEGFQPYHPPFRNMDLILFCAVFVAWIHRLRNSQQCSLVILPGNMAVSWFSAKHQQKLCGKTWTLSSINSITSYHVASYHTTSCKYIYIYICTYRERDIERKMFVCVCLYTYVHI